MQQNSRTGENALLFLQTDIGVYRHATGHTHIGTSILKSQKYRQRVACTTDLQITSVVELGLATCSSCKSATCSC